MGFHPLSFDKNTSKEYIETRFQVKSPRVFAWEVVLTIYLISDKWLIKETVNPLETI